MLLKPRNSLALSFFFSQRNGTSVYIVVGFFFFFFENGGLGLNRVDSFCYATNGVFAVDTVI